MGRPRSASSTAAAVAGTVSDSRDHHAQRPFNSRRSDDAMSLPPEGVTAYGQRTALWTRRIGM